MILKSTHNCVKDLLHGIQLFWQGQILTNIMRKRKSNNYFKHYRTGRSEKDGEHDNMGAEMEGPYFFREFMSAIK